MLEIRTQPQHLRHYYTVISVSLYLSNISSFRLLLTLMSIWHKHTSRFMALSGRQCARIAELARRKEKKKIAPSGPFPSFLLMTR